MTITHMVMGYCLPLITTMLFRDWWYYRSLKESVNDS